MANKGSGGKKKKGRKQRVDLRRNRGKAVRDKSAWTGRFRTGAIESDDARQSERVRGKGDLSRKRTIIVDGDAAAEGDWREGVVVAMRGLVAEVDDGKATWACTVRRVLRTRLISERHPVAVGDHVQLSPVLVAGEAATMVSDSRTLPEGVIEEVAPRTTTLTRHYDRRVQVIAANVDTAVICMAADHPTLRPHLIDRYLVSVHHGDMRPVICVNKADLDVVGAAAEVIERYTAIGYAAMLTSAESGVGLDALREAIGDRTSCFVGPSGVGKSSLLNAMHPGFDLKTGVLSELQRGRHTTTTARLLRWPFGGYVVDTPGIRQFELVEIPSSELEAYFKEFIDLIPDCGFPDCSHTHEGNCAVIAAVESGDVHEARHESYCRMREECVEKERQYDR